VRCLVCIDQLKCLCMVCCSLSSRPLSSSQTSIRELSQSCMNDPTLNPFIEVVGTLCTGHSRSSSTALSRSPRLVIATDTVVPGPTRPELAQSLRAEFTDARDRLLGLTDVELSKLWSASQSNLTKFAVFTLRAVRGLSFPCFLFEIKKTPSTRV
jgi:hypothetical protein